MGPISICETAPSRVFMMPVIAELLIISHIATIIIGIDFELGAHIFKLDPAGYFVRFHAAAGRKQQEAMNHSKKKMEVTQQWLGMWMSRSRPERL
jgi:hypothetical protein